MSSNRIRIPQYECCTLWELLLQILQSTTVLAWPPTPTWLSLAVSPRLQKFLAFYSPCHRRVFLFVPARHETSALSRPRFTRTFIVILHEPTMFSPFLSRISYFLKKKRKMYATLILFTLGKRSLEKGLLSADFKRRFQMHDAEKDVMEINYCRGFANDACLKGER